MNQSISTKRFILTGTPGSGKTSVIKALEKLGHSVIHEAATDVIAAEQHKGNRCPWQQSDFIDKIVLVQKTRQISVAGNLQFYDRSPFCTYALGKYLLKCQGSDFIPTGVLAEEMKRCLEQQIYQKRVFFFENLGFIEPTEARQIRYEDALIFEQIHLEAYKELGFDILRVPKNTIEKRCEFILKQI